MCGRQWHPFDPNATSFDPNATTESRRAGSGGVGGHLLTLRDDLLGRVGVLDDEVAGVRLVVFPVGGSCFQNGNN